MNLSEIISRLGTGTLPTISMLMFLAVFIAVAVKTLRPSARAELRRAGSLPLDGDDHE